MSNNTKTSSTIFAPRSTLIVARTHRWDLLFTAARTSKRSPKLCSSLWPRCVPIDADFDSDQETFIVAGVPIYSLRVDPGDYDARHHTIIDTFERVDPRMLALHTAIMAVAGYSFANAETRPGPRLTPAEVQDLLKRTGLEALYQLEYSTEKPQH